MDATRYRGIAVGGLVIGAVLVAGALAGCGVASTSRPEVNANTLNSSAPDTGSTAPAPDSGGGGVSVELAQLPIGGNATQDPDTLADTCVTVNWIVQQDAAKIPSDVQITITGASFTSDVYAIADSGCDGDNPACIGFVFDEGHQICDLAVEATGSSASGEPEPGVSVSGVALCGDGQSAVCEAFLRAVSTEQNLTIPLDEPPTDQGAGSSPDEPTV